jgi:hypothetical protein
MSPRLTHARQFVSHNLHAVWNSSSTQDLLVKLKKYRSRNSVGSFALQEEIEEDSFEDFRRK